MPRHAEQKLVRHTPEELFDLVADIGRYPEFLPWCVGAKIRTRTETMVVADLTIGFGPFRESFASRVILDRPNLIKVAYENGPFKHMDNRWGFKPHPEGCVIDFFVDFDFRSRLLQMAIGTVFQEAVRRMVMAFIRRADQIYGPPTRTIRTNPALEGKGGVGGSGVGSGGVGSGADNAMLLR
jgi:coenzyme Q-binding protein COQ10